MGALGSEAADAARDAAHEEKKRARESSKVFKWMRKATKVESQGADDPTDRSGDGDDDEKPLTDAKMLSGTDSVMGGSDSGDSVAGSTNEEDTPEVGTSSETLEP